MDKKKIIGAVIIIVIILFFIFSGGNGNIVDQSASEQMLDVPAELLSDNTLPSEQSKNSTEEAEILAEEEISKLQATISSPSSFQGLIDIAVSAPSVKIRKQVEKVLISYLAEEGYSRTVAQLKVWLNKIRTKRIPKQYEDVLKSVDPSCPFDMRMKYFVSNFEKDNDFGLRLAVASGFDSEDLDGYQELIALMIGEITGKEKLDSYSVLGLILSQDTVSAIFSDEIQQNINKLKKNDILWVLPERNDLNTRAVADLAMKQNLLPPVRMSFLRIVRDREDLPADVLSTLISAAAGSLKVSNLISLNRWIDKDSEKILLLILADSKDQEITTRALEILASKSLTMEPSSFIVKWVKERHWAKRQNLAHAIGVLGLTDLMTNKEIKEAFYTFDIIPDAASQLFKFYSKVGNAKVMLLLLDSYKDSIALNYKLLLLDNRNKDVRKVAISSIDTNNAIALKIVLDHYQKERDPELRQVYKKHFPDLLRGR